MTLSDDEDEFLAQFLESEVLSGVSDQEEEKAEEAEAEEERQPKKLRVGKDDKGNLIESTTVASAAIQLQATKGEIIVSNNIGNSDNRRSGATLARIDTGVFGKVPPELFHHILKFLSSEDLISCSLACRFLNYAASDESLWRRLYCMRWGLLHPTTKFRESAWKKLYIQRDEEDMAEFVRNCPSEFKEYYIQMQAAKRSQTPLPSQVNDDRIILDKTLADQVSIWKSSRGLTDKVFLNHDCSGDTCTYYQIGDVYVCEKTGHVHVCDDTCREAILDPTNELLVCRISGHCFDRLLSPDEMEPDIEQQQGGADEAEPFMGSGRFGRAYLLGYNCADEKELNAVLRFC